ncbi:MAG TPA: phosphate ABC transporter permease subunit PstC [Thermoleophilia bacterium]|nr:phosphate ABC transporter permease subunit PstC [Thermoleophilia bacterium]
MSRASSFLPRVGSLRLGRWLRHGDRPWQGLLIIAAMTILAAVVAIGLMLWNESGAARATFGWRFLIPSLQSAWDPVNDRYQAWAFVYGTLITSGIAIALAVPVGVGVAVFLAELCPRWLHTSLDWLVELLAAIPSVVYGLWGIFVFLPVVVEPVGKLLESSLGRVPLLSMLFSGPIPASGSSRLAAGLILSIMILPTIAAVTRDVFRAIPDAQREASLALGATRWETIWRALIPYGTSGILGAVILGLGRALGETMAVTMVIGNSIESSPSLLRPGYTMSSVIANEFAEAVSKMHTQVLVEVGLILFVMTLLLNALARLLVWRVARRSPMEVRA